MSILKISSADITDMSNQVSDYSIDSLDTDSPVMYGETKYICDWTKWHGYYRQIPELASVIDKKALWTVGKGFKADVATKEKLNKIKGWGKDTFNTILYNLCRTYTIAGDSYAEIIRDKAGRLINLKPLSPYSIQIVADEQGIIKRYEQLDRNKKIVNNFEPKEILHFCWNRIGDEIHGISTIEKVEKIILMRNESMEDLKKIFHRYVKPLIISKVDTDDASEIAAYKVKLDRAVSLGENLIIPKDTAEMERMSIPQYSTLDPLPWLRVLQQYFISAEGVPEVILGWGSDTTEATSKILYLAFEQMVEHNQLFIEDNLKSQLGIEINLEFPASIEPDLKQDTAKDKGQSEVKGMEANKDE